MGHRIAKHSLPRSPIGVLSSADELEHSTYYVLEEKATAFEDAATTNVSAKVARSSTYNWAVYEREVDAEEESVNFYQAEKHLYGSARLGVLHDSIELLGTVNDDYDMTITNHRIGLVNYELTNHLGNVLSTISDKPIPHDNSGTVDYFLADIRQATDYSPFGVTLSGRNFTLTGAEKGRFGYQGSEMDNEVKGEGDSYTTEFRQLDPRLGRWFSMDPVTQSWQSPYSSMNNSPVITNDKLGLYGEKRAKRIAEKQNRKTHETGITASVSRMNDQSKEYRVNYFKDASEYGGAYLKSMYKGTFKGFTSKNFEKDELTLINTFSDGLSFGGLPTTPWLPTIGSLDFSLNPKYYSNTYKVQSQVETKIIDGDWGDKLSVTSFQGVTKNLHQGENSFITFNTTKTIGNKELSYSAKLGHITYGSSPNGVFSIDVGIPFTDVAITYGSGLGVGLGETQIGYKTNHADGTFSGNRINMRPGGGSAVTVLSVAAIILTEGIAAPVLIPLIKAAF
jgi:RHS repeat-associated protein